MASTSLLLLDQPEATQRLAQKKQPESQQAALGQYMTPAPVAEFMADRFDRSRMHDVRLLDAGAGQGALTQAFVTRWREVSGADDRLAVDAFELDVAMVAILRRTLDRFNGDRRISTSVIEGDFISHAAERLRRGERTYTHAILNPPYKKIGSGSPARMTLAGVGIETVNLYTGFVALALDMLEPGGELVAIIPRSFCNGPYYKSFRRFVLDRAAIEAIHIFEARDKAFAEDNVLQENVIITLRKNASQGQVTISSSADAAFEDFRSRSVPFSQIVFPSDQEQFIHVPVREGGNALSGHEAYRSTLADIDVSVSTGPVVDFRLKRHLRAMPTVAGDAPLLYPGHFSSGELTWPRADFRKANAIALNADTQRWLYPSGFYVVVRRFSSKEERRRIVASLVDPKELPPGPIGFENHLNVFHRNRKSLPEDVARGLLVYLNAKLVDDWFRQFNGHTQVNATDLRSIPYPDMVRLLELGRWSKANPEATENEIDAKVRKLK